MTSGRVQEAEATRSRRDSTFHAGQLEYTARRRLLSAVAAAAAAAEEELDTGTVADSGGQERRPHRIATVTLKGTADRELKQPVSTRASGQLRA